VAFLVQTLKFKQNIKKSAYSSEQAIELSFEIAHLIVKSNIEAFLLKAIL
jgi:hypothetical protein